ncbi:hypothetical protein DLJ58_30195 [Micromonospora arida]|uniref:GP-PDE domain-containing protein n=1 Tax=Micromonospora arida TaxID=2203715 RepID=A0A3N9WQI9_9ACTN|nr:hypothetical protein DLJ58_30195 [Micromonospora arida]
MVTGCRRRTPLRSTSRRIGAVGPRGRRTPCRRKYQDLGKLTRAAGAGTVSANWQVHDPKQGTVASTDWYLRENPAYFHGPDVRTLQTRDKLKVIPYTVDDATVMQRVIDLGVDGIITDDPGLLVSVAMRNGLR